MTTPEDTLGEASQAAVGSPAGVVPAGLPARLAVGLFETPGTGWMTGSGVPWDVRYAYFTKGWANNWGYGAHDGSWGLQFMQESAAQGFLPAVAWYQMNDEPGGAESQFLAKTQTPATMSEYFGDFKLLMLRAKDFNKPLLVMIEPDGTGYLESQSGANPGAYAAVAASGVPELAGLPNTVAGWGLAFLQLRKAVGASNVILGIHVSGWANGRDLFYGAVTDPLQPAVDTVDAFLAPLGLATNLTGQTYDVLVGDPLDRDSDYYQVVKGQNRWWDASDTASLSSQSFNRYAEWLRLWNVKTSKRWVLWQLPIGNSNNLNVCNAGGPRQGYRDNRTEYFFGTSGAAHREKFATDGVLALLFGQGEGCQASYQNDLDPTGQPYLKTHAGPFLQAGGLPIPAGSGGVTPPPPDAGSPVPDAGTPPPPPPPGSDPSAYNFESGLQGFFSQGAVAATLSSSTVRAFSGTHALAVGFAGTGSVQVGVASPAAGPGKTVTFHLWVPAGAPLSGVQPYVQEGAAGNWRWTGMWIPAAALTFGAWNTFGVVVPLNATPLQGLGLQLTTNGSAATTALVDAIDWGAPPAPVDAGAPPPVDAGTPPKPDAGTPPGADPAVYTFETGTQGFGSIGAVSATLSSSTAHAFAGTHALAISFAGSGSVQAGIGNPVVPAGQTVTFHLWVPAGAPVASVQAYVQEGLTAGWRWTGTWVPVSGLTLGAWNTLAVTVPATATSLQGLGVQLSTNGAAATTAFVDSISWGGAAAPPPPPPPPPVVDAGAPPPVVDAGTPVPPPPPATLGCLKVMPLGDSITVGPNGGYRNGLYDSLTAAGCGVNYVGSQVDPWAYCLDKDHEGHPGFVIADIAAQTNAWLAAAQPDYVLLMIGTNDVAWWSAESAATIADRHAQLVDQIFAQRPNAWVIVASIPPLTSVLIPPNNVDRAILARDLNTEIKLRVDARQAAGRRIRFADVKDREAEAPPSAETAAPPSAVPAPPAATPVVTPLASLARPPSVPAPPAPVAETAVTPVEAGTPETTALAALRSQLEQLHTQLGVLTQRLAHLEDEARDRHELKGELDALRSQLANAEAARRAAEEQAEQHTRDADQAISGLIALDGKLARGDVALGEALDRAEAQLQARARADLVGMRAALENEDVATARLYLQQAIVDAQQAR